MKLMTAEEFKALPENTVYCKYEPMHFTEFGIKFSTLYHDGKAIDFASLNILDCAVDFDRLEAGKPVEVDPTMIGRDGYFEDDQMYAVWEKKDIEIMIAALQKCL